MPPCHLAQIQSLKIEAMRGTTKSPKGTKENDDKKGYTIHKKELMGIQIIFQMMLEPE